MKNIPCSHRILYIYIKSRNFKKSFFADPRTALFSFHGDYDTAPPNSEKVRLGLRSWVQLTAHWEPKRSS